MSAQEQVLQEIKSHIIAGFRFIYVSTSEETEFIDRMKASVEADPAFGSLALFVDYDEITTMSRIYGTNTKKVIDNYGWPIKNFKYESSNIQKKDMATMDKYNGISHPVEMAFNLENLNPVLDKINQSQFQGDKDKIRFIFFIKDAHLQFFIRTRNFKRIEDFFEKRGFNRADFFFVLISSFPGSIIPEDFSRYVVSFDYPLPGMDTMRKIITERIFAGSDEINEETDVLIDNFARAGVGLSEREFRLSLNLAMQEGEGRLTLNKLDTIHNQKSQILKTSNQFLEYITDSAIYGGDENFRDIGGMDQLKEWIKLRKLLINPSEKLAFNEEQREILNRLDKPKGLLLFGISGGGKSLMVRHIARLFKVPLLRLDIGRIYGQYVGQSERNIRETIRLAEAMSPCVLWIDEIEKGFAGSHGSGDSGTSSRVFGSFLTWMQEKKAMVFVVATANNITSIPPEMTRMGRFDALFFVPLPDLEGRKEIFKIHLRKYIPSTVMPDEKVDRLAADVFETGPNNEKLRCVTGAEIEQCVKNAILVNLHASVSSGDNNLESAIREQFRVVTPMYKNPVLNEQYRGLCKWAESRAIIAGAYDDNDDDALNSFGRNP